MKYAQQVRTPSQSSRHVAGEALPSPASSTCIWVVTGRRAVCRQLLCFRHLGGMESWRRARRRLGHGALGAWWGGVKRGHPRPARQLDGVPWRRQRAPR